MFYTYVHIRKDTGKIFYVGKGKNKQAWRKQGRNQRWSRTVEKHGHNVEILANWGSEQEAFDHEVLLISCFKDMGYDLVNMTSGGEGMSNPSSETRKRLSESHSGEKSYWFGKKHTQETKLKISLAKIGKKQSAETITKRIKSGINHPNFKGPVVATNLTTGKSIELLGATDMKINGFSHSKVSNCLHGKRKSHKNHMFKRLEK